MEVIKTLMIIQSLLMGESLAYKIPEISTDEQLLDSPDMPGLKETTEDQPDSVRSKPSHDTSNVAMDDKFSFLPVCPYEIKISTPKEIEIRPGLHKLVPDKSYAIIEVVCKEPSSESKSVTIGSTIHKICDPFRTGHRHLYCFQEISKMKWQYHSVYKIGEKWLRLKAKTVEEEVKIGCSCGIQVFQQGDNKSKRGNIINT